MKMYIARDKNGSLHLYSNKPYPIVWDTLDEEFLYWDNEGTSMKIDDNNFPEVTFENSPKEVELKLL
jgi:hypothetical protein